MEPTRLQIEKFTNSSNSINFLTWKSIFIASIASKGIQSSLTEQDEEIHGKEKLAAEKADANLLFEILNNIDKEPRTWALLNHPVTEVPVPWAGYLLWNALKRKYDFKAIPQEIFILNFGLSRNFALPSVKCPIPK